MVFQEVKWIRSNSKKLCPILRKAALDWYRPLRHFPCFLQRYYKKFKQYFHRIQVIVQIDDTIEYNFCTKDVATISKCKITNNLSVINSFSTKVNASKLEELLKHKNVKKVWYDGKVKAVLDISSKVVGAPPMWENGFTGKGIAVAVIDTGIYQHPDFGNRIVGFKDFVNSRSLPYDDNGHGTHVAGDIASDGSMSSSQYKGPAPDANLVGVKVLDRNGSGMISSVIQGIQWCIANKDTLGIRIISMSLGSQATQSYKDDPVCLAVESAWKAGIVVCVAAGNDGPESYTISSPGIDPLIITVGAANDMNTVTSRDDKIADFSSRGPTLDNIVKPDVISPGTNIISLRSPYSVLDKQNIDARVGKYYFTLSGTSMATPICSGVIALMLEADSSLTPDEIKLRLISSCERFPGIPETVQGKGLISAPWAIYYKP